MRSLKFAGRIVILAVVAMVAACGRPGVDERGNVTTGPNSVYGTWGGFPVTEIPRGLGKVFLQLRIEPGQVSSIARCEVITGEVVTTTATTKADITPTSIKTHERKQAVETRGGVKCTATIEAKEFTYKVANNELEITMNGDKATLKRE